jgi:hypothetical protein
MGRYLAHVHDGGGPGAVASECGDAEARDGICDALWP